MKRPHLSPSGYGRRKASLAIRMLAVPVCALALLGTAGAQDVPVEYPAPAAPPSTTTTTTTTTVTSGPSSMPTPVNGQRSPSFQEAQRAAQEQDRIRVETSTLAMRDFQAGKAFELNGELSNARAQYVAALDKLKTVGMVTPLQRDVQDHLRAINFALINKGVTLAAR